MNGHGTGIMQALTNPVTKAANNPIVPMVVGAVGGALIGVVLGRIYSNAKGHPREALKISAALGLTGALLYGLSAAFSLHESRGSSGSSST